MKLLNLTNEERAMAHTVVFNVNRFEVYRGDVMLTGAADRESLVQQIKDNGLKNVTFQGIAITKYMAQK